MDTTIYCAVELLVFPARPSMTGWTANNFGYNKISLNLEQSRWEKMRMLMTLEWKKDKHDKKLRNKMHELHSYFFMNIIVLSFLILSTHYIHFFFKTSIQKLIKNPFCNFRL